jgi:hypothetical protein
VLVEKLLQLFRQGGVSGFALCCEPGEGKRRPWPVCQGAI